MADRADRRPAAGQRPLPVTDAVAALARCVARTVSLLRRRQVHLPRARVGQRVRFADGTTARVYRETAADVVVSDPCVLVVCFRLRGVHGRGHAAFRAESLLNTPLFVGFPGFVAKLWMAHDQQEVYRGIYQWDGTEEAEHYARALWRVLALVSEPGSIGYVIVPGVRRDSWLAGAAPTPGPPRPDRWWTPIQVTGS